MLIVFQTHTAFVDQNTLETGITAAPMVFLTTLITILFIIEVCLSFCFNTDMGDQVAITGTTAHFRCDDSCNFDVSCSRVTWYKNGALVNTSQNRYGLANDGVLLYLERLTSADTAEYTCQVQAGRTIFNRSGSLEVVDLRKTNLAILASCCK